MKPKPKSVPELRFPGFVGDWVSTRACNVFSIFNGYAFSSDDAEDDGCRWIKIADVGVQRMDDTNLSYLPSSFRQQYKKFILCQGDIVIALTRPILNKQLKVAKIEQNQANSLLNQRVGKIVSNNLLIFVFNILQRQIVVSQIDALISGTDPPNLAPSEIANISIGVPRSGYQND